MTTEAATVDREEVVASVQAASAGLSRSGQALVTESVPYEAEPAEEERSLVVTLSTGDRDRHGDVLDPEGAQLANFRRNPVVLFAHRHDLPAVGKVLWVRALPGRLVAKVVFAKTSLGEELHSLYVRGYMKAWSVGFVPHEWERMQGDKPGVRVSRWELLEVSAVPVPANPEALSKAIADGEVREPVLVRSLGERTEGASGDATDAVVRLREEVGVIAAALAEHEERIEGCEKRGGENAKGISGLVELARSQDITEKRRVLEIMARAAGEAFERRIRALRGRIE